MCWANLSARDSAADLWLFWREMEKAVGRQGGDAAASRGIRSRLGVARFEISDVLSPLARLVMEALKMRSANASASPTGYQVPD